MLQARPELTRECTLQNFRRLLSILFRLEGESPLPRTSCKKTARVLAAPQPWCCVQMKARKLQGRWRSNPSPHQPESSALVATPGFRSPGPQSPEAATFGFQQPESCLQLRNFHLRLLAHGLRMSGPGRGEPQLPQSGISRKLW